MLRKTLSCDNPYSLWICICIPWAIFLMWSISSWCSSGEGGGTTSMFCAATVYPCFPEVATAFLCLWWAYWKKILKFDHVFWLVAWRRHYLMLSLKIAVCDSWVIPFETTMVSAIVCPLFACIISPSSIFLSTMPGVLRCHRSPSSWQSFPLGWFNLLLHISRIIYVAYLGRTIFRILLASPPVVKWRLVPPPLLFSFSNLHQRRFIFETELDFAQNFQFQALGLWHFPW